LELFGHSCGNFAFFVNLFIFLQQISALMITVYGILGPDDSDSFLMELSGFLRECSELHINKY